MPSKFTRGAATLPKPTAPVATVTQVPDTVTYEGGAGFTRDAKSELFLLGITNMVSEDTFYEGADSRDKRFEDLVSQVALEDPGWIARFIPYLRDTMNMRSASVVLAAEAVHTRLASRAESVLNVSHRGMVDAALQRADEPADLVGYWKSRYGRGVQAALPMPVKRGLADAVLRLYNERSALKHDSREATVRMGDVIELVHPEANTDWQRALFQYLIDRRHNRDNPRGLEHLPIISARLAADRLSQDEFRAKVRSDPEFLKSVGATWEWASAKYGELDAAFWTAMVPEMGYMALLRNLRNFSEKGIDFVTKQKVIARLADPEQVAKSRQFPLRFYSAWTFAKALDFGPAIEEALNRSVANIPSFPGRTLVLVDMSGSMNAPLSARSKLNRDKAAAVFGSAVALRAEDATLVGFGTDSEVIRTHKGDSILRTVDRFHDMGGTNTLQALAQHYAGHDRVIILTDEQAWGGYGWGLRPTYDQKMTVQQIEDLPIPIYTFNLAGYKAGHLPSGKTNRYTFGGLTDAGFSAIAMLERFQNATWPF